MNDNMQIVSPGFYLVRTQAGLRKALRNALSDFPDWQTLRYVGYPTAYPSIVTISICYDGDEYIQCHAVHVNKLHDALTKA